MEDGETRGLTELTSEGVFDEYGSRIHRYILRLVRDPAEAEDLTQETFLRVHRKLDTLKDPATLSVWLYRIATHVCYDRFRQHSYRDSPPDTRDGQGDGAAAQEESGPRLDQVIERSEMNACIREYIEHLSDSYRMAILLHDLHGMSNPEIAGALGISLSTVKIRIHRARLRLKAALDQGCDLSHDDDGAFVCEPKAPE